MLTRCLPLPDSSKTAPHHRCAPLPLEAFIDHKAHAAFGAVYGRRLLLNRYQGPAIPADEVCIYLYRFVSLLFYPGHAAAPLCDVRLLRVYGILTMLFYGSHNASAPVALCP